MTKSVTHAYMCIFSFPDTLFLTGAYVAKVLHVVLLTLSVSLEFCGERLEQMLPLGKQCSTETLTRQKLIYKLVYTSY